MDKPMHIWTVYRVNIYIHVRVFKKILLTIFLSRASFLLMLRVRTILCFLVMIRQMICINCMHMHKECPWSQTTSHQFINKYVLISSPPTIFVLVPLPPQINNLQLTTTSRKIKVIYNQKSCFPLFRCELFVLVVTANFLLWSSR